jgi:hypothetical protein
MPTQRIDYAVQENSNAVKLIINLGVGKAVTANTKK